MEQLLPVLRGLQIFQTLTEKECEEISSYCKLATYSDGETILAQNEPPGDFFVIVEGKAEIILENKIKENVSLGVISEGDHFGEMSILTGEPTSASIKAISEMKVLRVKNEGFVKLLNLNPELSQTVIRALSLRLKKTNLGVWEARNKQIALTELLRDGQRGDYIEFIGKSKEIKEIRKNIPLWATSNEVLYIIGEKGTGKELLAHTIHSSGPRKNKPFISVECGSIKEDVEEKFFGKFGFLDLAEGGTLLLRGIELLDEAIVNKLLGFLEHPFFDIRLIVISDGKSSQVRSLNNSIVINLPPLRQRKKDIPLLVDYFLQRYEAKHKLQIPSISKDAFKKILSYDYYNGNIMELDEVLERAFLLVENGEILSDHIYLGKISTDTGIGFNLLQIKSLLQAIQKGIYPGVVQALIGLGLVFILFALFFNINILGLKPEIVVWGLWWPLMVLSIAFLGRIYCSICPVAFFANLSQKIYHLNKPVPNFLKKFDFAIITFLFLLVFWVEEVTYMRYSGVRTGYILIAILAGAVFISIIFQRHTWCRHVCPLGGMIGVCSLSAPIELRSNPEVCLNKCSNYSCYKGEGKIEGCPMFQHAPFIDTNQVCKLCMRCVRTCKNDSIRLNLRPPAQEIHNLRRINPGFIIFILALLALVAIVTTFENLKATMPYNEWVIWFSLTYWGVEIFIATLVWLILRKKFEEEKHLSLIRACFSFAPLALATFIAYHIQYLPLLPEIGIQVLNVTTEGQMTELSTFYVMGPLTIATLFVGLFITAISFRKSLKKTSN